jgi:hippurate hydrolase
MNHRSVGYALLVGILAVAGTDAQQAADLSLDRMIDQEVPSLVAAYKVLHAAPELSHHEEKTAAFVASELRSAGFAVTERVGKYERPEWTGYGVVAVMKNGEGPTVLVRADLDALPIEERTGLPYASTVKAQSDSSGQTVGVMHACGHDIHIASLIGTARVLAQIKDRWRGTLLMIGQPAEETVDGARAMLRDGLYTRFPKPDYAIALHDWADLEAGRVGFVSGYAQASLDSVDITIRGIGAHGSRPNEAKDPIVVAAQVVLALQTIISRENSPLDPAVVTVGSIHGGSARNIIPEEVKLQLTVRAYKEEVRKNILASIERIARNTAFAAGVPEARAPIVTVITTERVDALYNDPALAERIARAFETALGSRAVARLTPLMGSEDFGEFGLSGHQLPIFYYRVGASDPAKLAMNRQSGTPIPSTHSPFFAPLPEPTIRTGVKSMTTAVLELTKK